MGNFGDDFDRETSEHSQNIEQNARALADIINKKKSGGFPPIKNEGGNQGQSPDVGAGGMKNTAGTSFKTGNAPQNATNVAGQTAREAAASGVKAAAQGVGSAGASAATTTGTTAAGAAAGSAASTAAGSAASTVTGAAVGAAAGSAIPIIGTIIGAVVGAFGDKIVKVIVAIAIFLMVLIGSFPNTISNKAFGMEPESEPPIQEMEIADVYTEKARTINDKFLDAHEAAMDKVENKILEFSSSKTDNDETIINPDWIKGEVNKACHLQENYRDMATRILPLDDTCFVLSAYGVASSENKRIYNESVMQQKNELLTGDADADPDKWYGKIAENSGDFNQIKAGLSAEDMQSVQQSLFLPPDGKIDRLMDDLQWSELFDKIYPVTFSEPITRTYDVPAKYESYVKYEGTIYTGLIDDVPEGVSKDKNGNYIDEKGKKVNVEQIVDPSTAVNGEVYVREDEAKHFRRGELIGETITVCTPVNSDVIYDENGKAIDKAFFIKSGETLLGSEQYDLPIIQSTIQKFDRNALTNHLKINMDAEYIESGSTFREVIDFYCEAIKAFLPEDMLYGDMMTGENWLLEFLISQLDEGDIRKQVFQDAADQLGIPYGGNGGYSGDRESTHRDCSSFVSHSYYPTFSSLGYPWFKSGGWSWTTGMYDSTFQNSKYAKSYSTANPGDILMWKGHTGIYLGDFNGSKYIIDAGTSNGVSVRELFNSSKWPLQYAIDPFLDFNLPPISIDSNAAMEYFSKHVSSNITADGDFGVSVIGGCTATPAQIDAIMPPAMQGLGQAFYDASNQNGIDVSFLIALAYHESGRGTSHRAKSQNNLFGWGNQTFSSKSECIIYVASRLKAKYIDAGLTTIDTIGNVYCPIGADNDVGLNQYWKGGVAKLMQEVRQQLG